MRKLCALLGLAAAVCLLAWGWLRQTDEKFTSNLPVAVLIGEQGGYLLTPPEFVAQPFIRRIEWSPDGNYAVLFQTALRAETPTLDDAVMRHRVLLWNRKTRRLSVLWESAQTNREMNSDSDLKVAFFGKSPACLFAVRELNQEEGGYRWMVYYAAFMGRVVPLGKFEDELIFAAPPADTHAYLVIWASEIVYMPVSPNGEMMPPRPIPEECAGGVWYTLRDQYHEDWFEDGLQLVVPHLVLPEHVEPSNTPENPVPAEERIAYTVWDPRTNKFFLARRKDVRYYRLRAAMPLETRVARHALQHAGNPAETSTTWLHENERAVLVASDSALAEVAPQGDAILYVAHGAAFYREIRRTSADALREMQARADREKYLSQARQIGVALMMYVQDYDEMFPPNFGDEGVAQVLLPYLKDMGIFEVNGAFAFRYRMDGQSLANIESPATTEVGYLELPNGRMVIYADGHVKWQPRR